MQRELERLDRQIKRFVDVILEGGDARPINVKLKELEAEKSRVTRELATSPKEEPLLRPNLAMIYRSRIDALEALFRDTEEGREAFEALRGLIDEVRIIPEGGEYRLELKGELAGILALAQGAKNAGESAIQRALQIKVVAGVGFEPTTFRL
jgi:site-specific DNA recombinase